MNLASEVVIGGCRLESVLGRGGVGTVYRATQLALGREVAVKVVPVQGVEDGLVERFKREARTAAGLDHPNLVPIHAAGEEDGVLYIVMRLIDGVDLGALLAGSGPLTPRDAVAVLEQIATALDAIHAAGLVHRDVKPANILIERGAGTERAYLSDFGLMRRVLEESAITRTGEWVGTIDYAAPEQLEGGTVGPAVDVYALGGVLYTALTATPPYPRETMAATAMAHATSPPPQIERQAALNRVITHAMAKRPFERYPSAGELATAARRAVEEPRRVGRRGAVAVTAAVATLVLGVGIAVAVSAGGAPSRTRFSAGATPSFGFAYPSGWHVVENDVSFGPFTRTRVTSANGSQAVIIDRTPGETLDLIAWTTGIERETAQTPGYRLVSVRAGAIGSRPAIVWRFELAGVRYPARVDVFQRLGGDGYAVLGEGSTFARAEPTALSVAGSLRPR